MVDVNYSVAASGDDGWCRTDEASFDNTSFSFYLGSYFGGNPSRAFMRFDNVAVPAGAKIDNAYIRFTAQTDGSTTVVNLNCYFEDADDPTAPTTAADLMARSLTTGVAWDALSAWTNGNTYDTHDLSAALQDVIDRGGWASGQAVIALIQDDGSTSAAQRQPSAYDYVSGAEAAVLYITYSLPYNIVEYETINITESASVVIDKLIDKSENIEITESVNVYLSFGGELTESQNIEISESVTVERGFSGELTDSENIQLSLFRDVRLGLEIPPLFESLTISEQARMTYLAEADDDIEVSESVTVRRGYDGSFTDSFTVNDVFGAFNYTNWVRQNLSKAKVRFYCTITGSADLTTDVQIPIRSFYARKKSGDPSYLKVVIPGFEYSGAVSNRNNGDIIVSIGYEVDGVVSLLEQISVVDIDDISIYEGAVNRSISVAGHRTISYSNNLVTIERSLATYRAQVQNVLTFRFQYIDPYLNPGDTLVVGQDSMTVNSVIYIVDALRATMEVSEA